MEIIRHDMCKHFARVTEYNGVLYFTGHIAAGKQPTMTEQMVALTHRLDELLEQFGSYMQRLTFTTGPCLTNSMLYGMHGLILAACLPEPRLSLF